MADQEHLDILKQGVETWNQWREQHSEIKPDLSQAGLYRADLSGADLHQTNLYQADLSEANLSHANLYAADLRRAILGRANLHQANLQGTRLIHADLHKTDLRGANLSRAVLSEADIHAANLNQADISHADLDQARLWSSDLSGAKLHHAHLSKADLCGAHLTHTNLFHAYLFMALLEGADLREANLREADLRQAQLSQADLTGADLTGADLSRATLVETNLTEVILTQCHLYGISAWNVNLERAKQTSLIITDKGEPMITVDNLEVAQFLYLLLNHKKLRDVLNAVTERGVLLLGRFGGGGLELLQSIAAKLREMRYLPIIFDFERPDSRDFTETIMTLAGLSRFVIVDLSGPSVPNELRATIPHFKIPFVPIIEGERKIFSMFPDFLGYPWVLTPVEFTNKEQLIELLPTRVIAPAEEKFKERQTLLNQLFNR